LTGGLGSGPTCVRAGAGADRQTGPRAGKLLVQTPTWATFPDPKEKDMHSNLEDGAVLRKTRELCQTIVSEPDFLTLRHNVETFLANDDARTLYQALADKGQQLHHKQHQGEQLTRAEIDAFEQEREDLMRNDIVRGFLEAQQQMQQVQETVGRYVMKAMELGRVPEEDDFSSCGQGCNCGH
jgi:cell fate (sporulation/competence/biofilm development) regulator YlbF (YheA/YmcA/DUF963 family)